MAGIVINLPWAKGDQFWVEATLAHGAGAYAGWTCSHSDSGQHFRPLQRRERGRGLGDRLDLRHAPVDERRDGPAADQLLLDCGGHRALLDAGSAESTSSAATAAADFNDIATTLFCSSPQSPIRRIGAPNTPLTGTTVAAGCNPDFNVWNVGVRTIWNPAPQFDVGVEVMYYADRDQA